jgi:hypothetical protein
MVRAIARQAEAERERRAKVIHAEGELQAAEKLLRGGGDAGRQPEAMQLRYLQREVFGWAMYDFANSGYTTVVLTAVFNAYFVGVVAGGADWATLAWTLRWP